MILTQTAPPAATPVTLAEFRLHLRLAEGFPEDTAEDALLDTYLRAAAAQVETRLAQALIVRPFRLATDRWNREAHLVLPVGPVAAIDAFRLEGGGETIALEAAEVALEPGRSRQRLTGPGRGALPTIPDGWRAVLEFEAGHGPAPQDVPADLRRAVTLVAARAYEDRAATGTDETGLPAAVEALLGPWRPARL